MSHSYIGAYWQAPRLLTLRQYADATRQFLMLLQKTHPAFQSLEWVGNLPDSEVALLPDLSNLDDLIYHHSARKERVYQHANPDGTPSWDSTCIFGYAMHYGTRNAGNDGLTVAISAGGDGIPTPNSVSIQFPLPEDARFPHREFYDFSFLKKLFLQIIAFWGAHYGRVTSHTFSTSVAGRERPYVGWLTYLRDPRAAALRNSTALHDLMFEKAPNGGTLISLGVDIISPKNVEQVAKARRLRDILIAEKLV